MKKPRLADVNAALTAVLVALLCMAAFFYVFPSRHLFRGVEALALLVTLSYGVFVYGHVAKKSKLAHVNAALFAALVAMLIVLGVTGALYAAFPSLTEFRSGVANIIALLAGCWVFVLWLRR